MKIFSKFEAMYLEADKKLQNGKYQEALEILEQIIEQEPKFAPAYNHIGWLYLIHFDNLEKAEEYFKRTIQFDPSFAPVYPNYAVLLNSMGRFEELESLVSHAINVINVDLSALYYELGTMHEMKQNYVQAEENIKKAIHYTRSTQDLEVYSEGLERIAMKKKIFNK